MDNVCTLRFLISHRKVKEKMNESHSEEVRYVPALPQVKALAFKISLYERFVIFALGDVIVIGLIIRVQFGTKVVPV